MPAISAAFDWDMMPISYHFTAAASRISRLKVVGSCRRAESTLRGISYLFALRKLYARFSLPKRLAHQLQAQAHFDIVIHEQDAVLLAHRVEIGPFEDGAGLWYGAVAIGFGFKQ